MDDANSHHPDLVEDELTVKANEDIPEQEPEPEIDTTSPEYIAEQKEKAFQEKIAQLENEEIPLLNRIDIVNEMINDERGEMLDIPLKDYPRLAKLQIVMDISKKLSNQVEELMMATRSKMTVINESLAAMQETVDKKVTNEGLGPWMNQLETKTSDPESVAQEPEAGRTETKSSLMKFAEDVPSVGEQVAELTIQASEASVEANKAKERSLEANRTATLAKKAADKKFYEEEKAKRKAEEEKRFLAEEKRKRKEEAEKRKREAEILAATPEAIERRRLDAIRRDPANWPSWVFSVEPKTTGIAVGCVIKAMTDMTPRDDLIVENIDQLTGPFKLEPHEELVSNIIQISHTDYDFQLEEPLIVAIPHCAPRNSTRECVVKKLHIDGTWIEVDTQDITMEDIREYKFVECQLNRLTTLAVITRIKKEKHKVQIKGERVTSSVDSRVTFVIRPSTFNNQTTVTTEVTPVDAHLISDIRNRKPNCEGLFSSSPIIRLFTPLTKKYGQPIEVTVPLPPNPYSKQRQEQDTSQGGGGTGKVSAKQRLLSAIMHKDDAEEEKVYLLFCNKSGNWSVIDGADLKASENSDKATFVLEKPAGKVIVIRVEPNLSPAKVEKIPGDIDLALREKLITTILRQHNDDNNDVIIHSIAPSKIDTVIRKLNETGHDYGPETSESIVFEGQHLQITFRGNVTNGDDGDPIDVAFNSHIETKAKFRVEVVDTFAQKSIECYRGFAQLSALRWSDVSVKDAYSGGTQAEIKLIKNLLFEGLINLPKPDVDSPKTVKRAPVMVQAEGLITTDFLQDLASDIGDEWKSLANHLHVKKIRVQAIVRNNFNKEPEDLVYDMLLTWIKRMPKSVNKVDILRHALIRCGRADLADDLKEKEGDYKRERFQRALDSVLQKAFIKVAGSAHVCSDWQFLARELGVTSSEINSMESGSGGLREKTHRMLHDWRQAKSKNATPDALIEALRNCKFISVADQVKHLFKDSM